MHTVKEQKYTLSKKLAKQHGLKHDHPLVEKLFNHAWNDGHSSGDSEIENFYVEYMDLLPEDAKLSKEIAVSLPECADPDNERFYKKSDYGGAWGGTPDYQSALALRRIIRKNHGIVADSHHAAAMEFHLVSFLMTLLYKGASAGIKSANTGGVPLAAGILEMVKEMELETERE